jgi:hypothetical protein
MNINKIKNIITKCDSKSDVCRELGFQINGSGLRKVNELIKNFNLNVTHFNRGKTKRRKYLIIKKVCPICDNEFETKSGHPREKTVCSHACANTYFRSGKANPNYKNDNDLNAEVKYRTICFRYHEKKCVCCDEKNIIEVHHYDGNKKNNSPENLIPLCPTHHQYWHSKFRYLIKLKIDEYIKNFQKK